MAPREPPGLGMGGTGVVIGLLYTRTAENTSSQYVHVHKVCVSLKCIFQLRMIYMHSYFHRTHKPTLAHTNKELRYCGSGRAEECCAAKTKAEQNSTGDCINTQALCCTWRGPSPLWSLFTPSTQTRIHSPPLMSHSVHIRVNVLRHINHPLLITSLQKVKIERVLCPRWIDIQSLSI